MELKKDKKFREVQSAIVTSLRLYNKKDLVSDWLQHYLDAQNLKTKHVVTSYEYNVCLQTARQQLLGHNKPFDFKAAVDRKAGKISESTRQFEKRTMPTDYDQLIYDLLLCWSRQCNNVANKKLVGLLYERHQHNCVRLCS